MRNYPPAKSVDGTEERGTEVEEENVDRDLPEGHDGTASAHAPVDEPRAGVDKPRSTADEPHAGVDEARASVDEPQASVDEPHAAVDEAARPGSVDERATEPVAADPLMVSQFGADRTATDQESSDRETTKPNGRGQTAHETGDPVAPALGETTPAEAGQTTPTESISTDAAPSGPVSADASPEASRTEPDSTDPSVSEVDATAVDAAAPETVTDLKPGEAKVLIVKELWTEGVVDGYRERWHQVQVGFLDDPQDAATKAEALLGDVLEGLREALADRKSQLDSWSSTDHHDTEEMRVTVRAYRDLLDRVLSW